MTRRLVQHPLCSHDLNIRVFFGRSLLSEDPRLVFITEAVCDYPIPGSVRTPYRPHFVRYEEHQTKEAALIAATRIKEATDGHLQNDL